MTARPVTGDKTDGRAFAVKSMTTKAHPVIFTIEFDILLKHWQAAGLDKTRLSSAVF
jgi:hypothetical protein